MELYLCNLARFKARMIRVLKIGNDLKAKCLEIAESIGLLMQGDGTFADVASNSYWEVALATSDEAGVGIPVTITEWMSAVRKGHSLRLDAGTEVKGGEAVE